jgi:hypothetical protein
MSTLATHAKRESSVLLRILRYALYLQLVLGLVIFFGPYAGFLPPRGLADFHGLLGIIIAVLALIALRPLPGVPMTGVRTAAWLGPLVPLVLGLGFMFKVIPSGPLVPIHMLLGIIVVGLVEGAAGQQRRAIGGTMGRV